MVFEVEHAAVEPGALLRGHSHDAWHLVAVQAGAFEEDVGDSIMTVSTGGVRLSKPGASHEISVSDSGMRCVILDLPQAWMAGFAREMRPGRTDLFVQNEDIFNQVCAAATLTDPWGGNAQASLIVREALAGLQSIAYNGEVANQPCWLVEARENLRDGRHAERIGAIAQSAGLSREHFARAFRRYTGCRPSEYRSVLRALRTADLLRTTDTPLAALAADLGYVDQSHMTRELKRHVGYTPAAMRASLAAAA